MMADLLTQATATMPNESLFLPALSALGTLGVIILGWGVTILRAVLAVQQTQGTAITRIEVKLGDADGEGLIGKVKRIHDWKNKEMERQLDEANDAATRLHAENERLRTEGHLHVRSTERRD